MTQPVGVNRTFAHRWHRHTNMKIRTQIWFCPFCGEELVDEFVEFSDGEALHDLFVACVPSGSVGQGENLTEDNNGNSTCLWFP